MWKSSNLFSERERSTEGRQGQSLPVAVAADSTPSAVGAAGTAGISVYWPRTSTDLERAESLVATSRVGGTRTIHELLLPLSQDFRSQPDHHLEKKEGEVTHWSEELNLELTTH